MTDAKRVYCEVCGYDNKPHVHMPEKPESPSRPWEHAWGKNRGWYGPKLEDEGGLPEGWSTLSEEEIEQLRNGGEE